VSKYRVGSVLTTRLKNNINIFHTFLLTVERQICYKRTNCLMNQPSAVEPQNIDALKEALGNDLDLVLFYLTWLKNGMNATDAYKELHPDVTEASAAVLGHRQLRKVNKDLIMQAYGLDYQMYFQQLHDGLKAQRWNDFTGEREPDHKVRKPYHDKLGKLLEIESDTGSSLALQINTVVNIDRAKYQ
jgi:hypothetical protein